MQKNSWFKVRGLLALLGCIILSTFLVSIFMNFSAAASAQTAGERAASHKTANSPQKPYVIEFFYNDEFSQTAAIAADNFAALLAKETGLEVEASINPCEADLLRNLGEKTTDLAPLGFTAYVLGQEDYGFQAKLVNGFRDAYEYRGQLNIQASSGYTDIWDLQDKRFASSDPNSISSYMLPYLLISNTTGMTPTEFFSEVYFTGSQSQVIKDVYEGTTDCGAAYEDARMSVEGEYPDVFDVVEVLSYTEYIPNPPWVFRKGLNSADVGKLTDGIIAVAGTPDGEKSLQAIFGENWSGVDNILDSAYDPVRELVKTFEFQLDTCRGTLGARRGNSCEFDGGRWIIIHDRVGEHTIRTEIHVGGASEYNLELLILLI